MIRQEGGFSFSVCANQTNMLSFQQTEGYILKNSPVPKSMGQMLYI